eukprot:CAMPEP_0172575300 /NCGR_PEP_ID=MMETSP1067-20121228/137142_1 /TAXON_ID=265564 ORGANISM="Thalassiosira punctigera, Strain Tpunct2005C2" /NCGR_SAMPLE_ID=MMETSP1067 /ASSEMBLY_ACC=CAM_ASM_000444 /LENGTH=157 /DNA_ID=CAMNT_0013367949 /DNA_START=88 /DNA_END=561 /DNA_ORIENTATION=+
MRNSFLLHVKLAAVVAAANAFHLPQTPAAQTFNPSTKISSQTSYQSPWLATAPIAIVSLIFSFSPPSLAMEGNVAKGSEIFTSTCAGCHRGGQNFVKEKKTLQRDALEKFVGLDEEKVEAFFKGSFVHKVQAGGKLTDQEITDVVTYVVDQAKYDKW